MKLTSRTYLDYAAATPLAPEAYRSMKAVLKDVYGNPSAIHAEGQQARAYVESARADLARSIQVRPEFVTFTSGGTESNNLAIVGTIEALAATSRPYADMEVITTALEHPSVSETLHMLEKRGVAVRTVPVDEAGRVVMSELSKLLSERTVLVSLSYVNSEIGTIQPLHRIRQSIKEAEQKYASSILFHVDAAQAPFWLTCQFDTVSADLLALDFGKCGGPKGVGALVRSRRAALTPVTHGGGQEAGLRPGTESVASIVGGVAAFVAAQADYRNRAKHISAVRDEAIALLTALDNRIVLNGAGGDDRVANNINISILGTDTEFLAVVLDTLGVAVSTKSACAGAGGGESVVVQTITNDAERARSTLRLTLGPTSTISDIKRAAKVIVSHLKKIEPWQ